MTNDAKNDFFPLTWDYLHDHQEKEQPGIAGIIKVIILKYLFAD